MTVLEGKGYNSFASIIIYQEETLSVLTNTGDGQRLFGLCGHFGVQAVKYIYTFLEANKDTVLFDDL